MVSNVTISAPLTVEKSKQPPLNRADEVKDVSDGEAIGLYGQV